MTFTIKRDVVRKLQLQDRILVGESEQNVMFQGDPPVKLDTFN